MRQLKSQCFRGKGIKEVFQAMTGFEIIAAAIEIFCHRDMRMANFILFAHVIFIVAVGGMKEGKTSGKFLLNINILCISNSYQLHIVRNHNFVRCKFVPYLPANILISASKI